MAEEVIYEREMVAGSSWQDKTCFLCGGHFKKGEKIVLIVPPFEYKKEYKRLGYNAVVHLEEWLEFKRANGGSMDNVLRALGSTKKPKASSMTEQQKVYTKHFIESAYEHGFRDTKETKTGAKAKMNGSSDILEYNVYTDRIRHTNRRKSGTFGRLLEHQVTVNVWNRMHEIRGDGKRDNYSASDVVSNALNTVNAMMGK